jgi:hypothetical protein
LGIFLPIISLANFEEGAAIVANKKQTSVMMSLYYPEKYRSAQYLSISVFCNKITSMT